MEIKGSQVYYRIWKKSTEKGMNEKVEAKVQKTGTLGRIISKLGLFKEGKKQADEENSKKK